MKLLEPKVEFVKQNLYKQGMYEQIEKAARTCYKSEDKIKYDENGNSLTAESFVNNIVNVRKHGSVGEHGTVYLKYRYAHDCEWAFDNPYSRVKPNEDRSYWYVTTNYRVLQENGLLDHIEKYSWEYTPNLHYKRWTFRFYTQIAISREANRHRANSMAEQSTRYCNYSKDKFGNELNICIPEFINKEIYPEVINPNQYGLRNYCIDLANDHSWSNGMTAVDSLGWKIIDFWLFANLACEFSYQGMIALGVKPEDARTVLPLDTQTELVHTAYISDWIHFIKLRLAETAHPDMRILVRKMLDALIEAGEIDSENLEDIKI